MRNLINGSRITAEELETITGRTFDAREYSRLCNAVAWSFAWRGSTHLPSLTERVNVSDNGKDAEWYQDCDPPSEEQPFIKPGCNVYQYKLREATAGEGRNRIINSLTQQLRGALAEVEIRTNQQVENFVLFTNLHLTTNQNIQIKNAILEGANEGILRHVQILGSGELVTTINDLPHIRSAFFSNHAFRTLAIAESKHRDILLTGGEVKLIGRDNEVTELRQLIDDPQVRVISVTGPQWIGKSRLILESTNHREADVVFAISRDVSINDILSLVTPTRESIVVVEDPLYEWIDQAVTEMVTNDAIKLVIAK